MFMPLNITTFISWNSFWTHIYFGCIRKIFIQSIPSFLINLFANGMMISRIRIAMFTFYGFIDIFFKNYRFFTTIMWVIIKINEHGTKTLYQLTFSLCCVKKVFFQMMWYPNQMLKRSILSMLLWIFYRLQIFLNH